MYKLQMLGSKNMSAKEIQMVVQGAHLLPGKVEFTALNFFRLDYSMLCGVSVWDEDHKVLCLILFLSSCKPLDDWGYHDLSHHLHPVLECVCHQTNG